MLNPNAAALADSRLFREISGKALLTTGIALLGWAGSVVLCVLLSATGRTGLGLLAVAIMAVCGEVLTRQTNKRVWWAGTSLIGVSYALALFYAQATFYVAGLPNFNNGHLCWMLEFVLGLAAAAHLGRNSLLRYPGVLFTLVCTGHAMYSALASTEIVAIAGMSLKVSAIASVTGTIVLAALSALYQRLERSEDEGIARAFYRIAQESYFVATAASALAIPKFLDSFEYAPIWWALLTPVLIGLCWQSKSFLKHAFIMGIWLVSAGLVLLPGLQMVPFVRMAVPVAGLLVAMAYRYRTEKWELWQRLAGYAVYLYGAVALSFLVPLLQLSVTDAMPYFLLEAGAVIALALVLHDRILQKASYLTGAGALAVFGAHWQQWSLPLAGMVTLGCYAVSLVYGYIKKHDGWTQAKFSLVGGSKTITAVEATWLERIVAGLGYVTLMSGSFLLFADPYNTVAWVVEAFALITFGFATRKIGHRACGLIALFIGLGKLSIFDLSGAGGTQLLVSCISVGVSFIAAGIFYLVDYSWEMRRQQKEQERKEQEQHKDDEDNKPSSQQ